MARPLTYTKQSTLRVTPEQLEALRRAAPYGNVADFVRASALAELGRPDLILPSQAPVGARKPLELDERRMGELVWVGLTAEQHAVARDAARRARCSIGHVLRSAALRAAGAPIEPERPKGTRGRAPGSLARARKRRKAAATAA